LMWWLPEKWACCAPNEWERIGAIAHTFEHLLRKFAPLHIATSPNTITNQLSHSSASADLATERERNTHVNDVVLSIARRWNRSLHFRRFNDFHRATSCGFMKVSPPTTKDSSVGSSGDWVAHLKVILADPVAALADATAEWQAIALAWSQAPYDVWLQVCSRLALIRLLTLRARVDESAFVNDASSADNVPCPPWVQQCNDIISGCESSGVSVDATLALLRVLVMAEPPTRFLFKNLSSTLPRSNASSSTPKEWSARWLSLLNAKGLTMIDPSGNATTPKNSCWVRRYARYQQPSLSTNGVLVREGTSQDGDSFLLAYFTWLVSSCDDSGGAAHEAAAAGGGGNPRDHRSDAAKLFNRMAPMWSTFQSHCRDGFAAAVTRYFVSKLGYRPAVSIIEAVHLVASELVDVLWWNISPLVASHWLIQIAEVCLSSSDPREAINNIVDGLAELCGDSLAQALLVDDANDGVMIGEVAVNAFSHDDNLHGVDAQPRRIRHAGFPRWLAIFISDPLFEQR
jgi:hypothetical protein